MSKLTISEDSRVFLASFSGRLQRELRGSWCWQQLRILTVAEDRKKPPTSGSHQAFFDLRSAACGSEGTRRCPGSKFPPRDASSTRGPLRPELAPLRRHDRRGGVRRQDPAQPWPPLPLEPRPPAQPPAAPRLPGAGPSSTATSSTRSRSRIFPQPPGAVTRESAAAWPARPAPRPSATAPAGAARSLGLSRAGGAASPGTGWANPWCLLSPRPCLR